MSAVDVPVSVHLADLVRSAGDELDKVFASCDGYPAGGASEGERVGWLRSHHVDG
ncbi:hypothetical protein [Streptomyces syringium]|uniref:hypothetical protein n=1 Tax=Streptomyces syringium TaxID=76729 RepID=UPI003415D6BE